MREDQYLYLCHAFDNGDSLHPDVASEDYGFPQLTTPGLQVYVVPPPFSGSIEWHRILIWQAKQFKNGHRSWVRLPSYANACEDRILEATG